MRQAWKVLVQIYLSSLIAASYALCLAWLGLSPRLEQQGWHVLFYWTLAATVVALAAGIPGMYMIIRPAGRGLDRAGSGGPDLEEARRRVLNCPLIFGVFSFLLWFVPLLSMPVLAALHPGGPDAVTVALAFVATSGIAVVHSTFVIYIVERAMKRHFIPALLPEGRISRVRGFRPISVGLKLVLLFVTTALFPIFSFTAMYMAGTASTEAALYLCSTSIILGVTQSVLISRSIARPLHNLQKEMARVQEGDRTIRVSVQSAEELGRLSEGFNEMVEGLERGEFIKETFGSYVSRPVLDEVLKGRVALGGQRCSATVLFSDIRGFTSFSEKLPPEEVVHFLNRYLDEMVDVLVANGATIDKFVGDAVMATFGVPVAQEDHALRAVRSAVGMIERLEVINAEREANGEPPVRIGIGIHTGEVVAGNIGSEKKMEYTVIGDTVNTASRIEALNKRFDTSILISATTHSLVSDHVQAVCLEPASVKGKSVHLVVFEVKGLTART